MTDKSRSRRIFPIIALIFLCTAALVYFVLFRGGDKPADTPTAAAAPAAEAPSAAPKPAAKPAALSVAATSSNANTSAVLRDAQAAAKNGDLDIAALLYTKAIMLEPDNMSAVDAYVELALAAAHDAGAPEDDLAQAAGVIQSAILRGDQANFAHLRGALDKLNAFFAQRGAETTAPSQADALKEYRRMVDAIDPDDMQNLPENASTLETVVNELGGGVYDGKETEKLLEDARSKLERAAANLLFDRSLTNVSELLAAYDKEQKPEYAGVLLGRASASLADLIVIKGSASPKLVEQLGERYKEVNDRATAIRDREIERVRSYNEWAISVIRRTHDLFVARVDRLGLKENYWDNRQEQIAIDTLKEDFSRIDTALLDGDVARAYQEVYNDIYSNIKQLSAKIVLAEAMFKTRKKTLEDM